MALPESAGDAKTHKAMLAEGSQPVKSAEIAKAEIALETSLSNTDTKQVPVWSAAGFAVQ